MDTNENKTPAQNKAKTTKVDDREEIFVPRESGNTDPNLVIVLNGKNYVLPKGKKSLVPKAVAAEYERSRRAQFLWLRVPLSQHPD